MNRTRGMKSKPKNRINRKRRSRSENWIYCEFYYDRYLNAINPYQRTKTTIRDSLLSCLLLQNSHSNIWNKGVL